MTRKRNRADPLSRTTLASLILGRIAACGAQSREWDETRERQAGSYGHAFERSVIKFALNVLSIMPTLGRTERDRSGDRVSRTATRLPQLLRPRLSSRHFAGAQPAAPADRRA